MEIEFTGKINLSFEHTLKSIQKNIRDFYSDDPSITETELVKKQTSIDCLHKEFCDYIMDYIDEQLSIDYPYEYIQYFGGDEAENKIISAFKEWLINNAQKYGLH